MIGICDIVDDNKKLFELLLVLLLLSVVEHKQFGSNDEE